MPIVEQRGQTIRVTIDGLTGNGRNRLVVAEGGSHQGMARAV
jgi:hypothetical protein